MDRPELDQLLLRLRDGDADPATLARARELFVVDERFPADLRAFVLSDADDDIPGSASALLALVGEGDALSELVAEAIYAEAVGGFVAPQLVDNAPKTLDYEPAVTAADVEAHEAAHPWPIAEAVRDEAGGVDVEPAVTGAVGLAVPPLAAAVAHEAGSVSVWDAVAPWLEPTWLAGLLDHALSDEDHRRATARLRERPAWSAELTALASVGPALKAALAHEAGTVSVWEGVAVRLRLPEAELVPPFRGAALAEAVRAEAGDVDVVGAVLERVSRTAVAPDPMPLPEPANAPSRGFAAWLPLALAAALALFVIGSRFLPMADPAAVEGEAASFAFSGDGEVVMEIEDYAEDVMVHVEPVTDDEGRQAVILWVDEA